MYKVVKDVFIPVLYFMKTRSIKMEGPNRRLHGQEHLSCTCIMSSKLFYH